MYLTFHITVIPSTQKRKLLLESCTRGNAVHTRVVPSPHSSDTLPCIKALQYPAPGGGVEPDKIFYRRVSSGNGIYASQLVSVCVFRILDAPVLRE